MTDLLVDIGNTRLKWRLQEHGLVKCSGAILISDLSFAQLQAALPTSVAGVYWASVASDEKGRCLEAWAYQKNVPHHQFTTQEDWQSLINGYQQAQSLGVDRWLAMVAARQFTQSAVCVVDCGSAITFDYVNCEGCHEGSYIIPGARLMSQALARDTAKITFTQKTIKNFQIVLQHDPRTNFTRSFQRWVEQNLHRDERNLRTLASTLCTRGWFSLESFPHGIMDQAGLSRCKKLLLSKVKDVDGLTERGHVVVWGQRGQGLEEHDATSPSPTDSTTVVVRQNVVATTTTTTTAASLKSLHRETCFQLLHSRMTLLTSSLRRLHSLLFDNFAVSSGLVGVVMDLRSLRHQSSTSAPSRCVAIKKPKHACAGAFLLLSNGNGKKLQGAT